MNFLEYEKKQKKRWHKRFSSVDVSFEEGYILKPFKRMQISGHLKIHLTKAEPCQKCNRSHFLFPSDSSFSSSSGCQAVGHAEEPSSHELRQAQSLSTLLLWEGNHAEGTKKKHISCCKLVAGSHLSIYGTISRKQTIYKGVNNSHSEERLLGCQVVNNPSVWSWSSFYYGTIHFHNNPPRLQLLILFIVLNKQILVQMVCRSFPEIKWSNVSSERFSTTEEVVLLL